VRKGFTLHEPIKPKAHVCSAKDPLVEAVIEQVGVRG